MEAESLSEREHPASLCIMMPVYNDWPAAFALLGRLDAALDAHGERADVIMVDDGSTASPDAAQYDARLAAIQQVSILRLRRNLGHQRAIAIGIAYVHANCTYDVLCIMDADGEDAPSDIPRLLGALRAGGGDRIIFAERSRRSESRLFQCCYWLYRVMHVVLTGHRVRFGNFSVVPWRRLENLASVSELWNHYVAAVITARLPYDSVPAKRATRIGGTSKMGFQSLVIHGLRALSVFSDTIGLRLMLVVLTGAGLLAAGVLAVAALQVLAGLPIAPWLLQAAAFLLVLFLQNLLLVLLFVFVMLAGRSGTSFLPSRDYAHFVADFAQLPVASGGSGA